MLTYEFFSPVGHNCLNACASILSMDTTLEFGAALNVEKKIERKGFDRIAAHPKLLDSIPVKNAHIVKYG